MPIIKRENFLNFYLSITSYNITYSVIIYVTRYIHNYNETVTEVNPHMP